MRGETHWINGHIPYKYVDSSGKGKNFSHTVYLSNPFRMPISQSLIQGRKLLLRKTPLPYRWQMDVELSKIPMPPTKEICLSWIMYVVKLLYLNWKYRVIFLKGTQKAFLHCPVIGSLPGLQRDLGGNRGTVSMLMIGNYESENTVRLL